MKNSILLISYFICLSSTSLGYESVVLFQEGTPIASYPKSEGIGFFKNLSGQVVQFSDGSLFRLGEIIGYGSNSVIFELPNQPGRAIRIPLFVEKAEYINFTIDGFRALSENEVPTIKLFETLRGEYIVVEHVRRFATFYDLGFDHYFTERTKKGFSGYGISQKVRISQDQRVIMEKEFLRFTSGTALFQEIGDLFLEQIVFDLDRQRWVLIDWHHKHLINPDPNNRKFAVMEAFERAGLVQHSPTSSLPYKLNPELVNQGFTHFFNQVWRALVIAKEFPKGSSFNEGLTCSKFLGI